MKDIYLCDVCLFFKKRSCRILKKDKCYNCSFFKENNDFNRQDYQKSLNNMSTYLKYYRGVKYD